MAIWQEEFENIWPCLKVLMFQTYRLPDFGEGRSYSTLRYLASLNRGNSLQHIRFKFGHSRDTEQHPDVFAGNHDLLTDLGVFPQLQLHNLRCLRSERMWISPVRARSLLSNAVKNEKLTSFDILFPVKDINRRLTADASVRHLKGYDWLRGTSSIHTLGCHDFLFSFDPEDEEGRLLPQVLATFPNLRTLTISSKHYGDAELTKLILEILKATHLKTIYTINLEYKEFLMLKHVARSKGTN